jgi:hypothetical protein
MNEPNTNSLTPSEGSWDPMGTGYRAGRSGPALASGGIHAGDEGGHMGPNEHGQPVSRDWLEAQGRQHAINRAVEQGYDPKTQTMGVMAGINVDHNPDAWLRAHGLACTDANGRDCTPSPAQARGLVQAMLRAQVMNAGYPEASTSLSYLDESLPARYARAYGRRL